MVAPTRLAAKLIVFVRFVHRWRASTAIGSISRQSASKGKEPENQREQRCDQSTLTLYNCHKRKKTNTNGLLFSSIGATLILMGSILTNSYDMRSIGIFVIGSAINGCGTIRAAVGRGFSVALTELDDIGRATFSASTKLFHGGLGFLEYFEFQFVRQALSEREVLLKATPHIAWPMRFESNTPTSRLVSFPMSWMKGSHPEWLSRLGWFLYNKFGGREVLAETNAVTLASSAEGAPLQQRFAKAFEYSDCCIEDARLASMNARDTQERGTTVIIRTKVISADCVRLVRGSHIVTHERYGHGTCSFFQGTDGRRIFAIPYETGFTLIGTTGADHADLGERPECSDEEHHYIPNFASQYCAMPASKDDIVSTHSGVVLRGGEFAIDAFDQPADDIQKKAPWFGQTTAESLVRAYGKEAKEIFAAAESVQELGANFDNDLHESGDRQPMVHELTQTADDVLWRRTKLGLQFEGASIEKLQQWMENHRTVRTDGLAAE